MVDNTNHHITSTTLNSGGGQLCATHTAWFEGGLTVRMARRSPMAGIPIYGTILPRGGEVAWTKVYAPRLASIFPIGVDGMILPDGRTPDTPLSMNVNSPFCQSRGRTAPSQ
ncbi:MAG: hypothetical protein MUC99_03415 [Anaerolineae bacterium]|jgi:hypothetical protein|nr:hypothetical protein [Anaerolineae bacterium]